MLINLSSNLQIFKVKIQIAVLWILFGMILTVDFTLKGFNQAEAPSQQLSAILFFDAAARHTF